MKENKDNKLKTPDFSGWEKKEVDGIIIETCKEIKCTIYSKKLDEDLPFTVKELKKILNEVDENLPLCVSNHTGKLPYVDMIVTEENNYLALGFVYIKENEENESDESSGFEEYDGTNQLFSPRENN